jgi:hypothetical protein
MIRMSSRVTVGSMENSLCKRKEVFNRSAI